MATLPENQVTTPSIEEISNWNKLKERLNKLKIQEIMARKSIFGRLFPNPIEGSHNKHDLGDGFQVSGEHTVNRKIDEAALETLANSLIEQNIPVPELIKWKPELVKKEYNKLTKAQLKQFDKILIVSDGTPAMKVMPIKR